MKPFLLFAFFSLFALSPFTLSSQTTGKEFWICIPPNEVPPFPTSTLDIYVGSAFDTEVTVTDYAANRSYKRSVKAGQTRVLSDSRGETNWTWEVREFEKPVAQGIRITAPKPISVHVLNSKVTTTDGFRAYPVSDWGMRHIVAAYYDFREGRAWAAGFCIVAREPTTVKIKLQGVGGSSAKTSGGKSIGDSITVDLDAGEVYAVCGDGTTRGEFDLTGTIITSTKPVGVIGFHQRTTMPNLLVNGNGRNHLVEALPPTFMWGKKYVTTEFRRSGTNPNAKGDMFRIVASEPNTKWIVKSYGLTSKQLTSTAGGQLTKAGDFADLAQSSGPTVMPNGFTVIEADKPILVVQYSNSSSFDGDASLDPFMIVLVPVEQFVSSSIWMTAVSQSFTKHVLSVIVHADTSDPEYIEHLKSITIDGTPLWNHPNATSPTLLQSSMGDGLYWASVDFATDAITHQMKSDGQVRMSGIVYGYGSVDAYGWPLASAGRDLRSTDTMPPVISGTLECGTFNGTATETRNVPNPPRATPHDSDQVETGIAEIDTVAGANSYNYRLVLMTDVEFPRSPAYTQFRYKVEVVDRSKPAYCEYYVMDWARNVTFDTVRFLGPDISVTPEPISFGEIRVGERDTVEVSITNNDVKAWTMNSVSLMLGDYFSLISPPPPLHTLRPGETLVLSVEYRADRETQNSSSDFDTDTLIISDTCSTRSIPISGIATQPLINVEDYNADYISPGIRKCKTGGLIISNNGTDTLVITGFTGYEGTNFAVTPQALSALPYVVLPKSTYQLRDVCYQRMDEGIDSITVTFQSNAAGPKPTSIWKARTTVTSVEEDAPSAFNVTTTAGTINVAWKGADIARIKLVDLQGRQIVTENVAQNIRSIDLVIPSSAPALVFLMVYNSDGDIIHRQACIP